MQNVDQAAQDLPDNDDRIDTDYMGDCISVVVLWDFLEGRAARMRGFHGFGGWEAINFPSLFEGVPNNLDTTVFVITEKSTWREENQARISQTFRVYLQNARKGAVISARAIIDRWGRVTYDVEPQRRGLGFGMLRHLLQ